MTLDLHLIRHALALAKHRNFGRAAQALHVSQPTISRNIAALERSVGAQLFDRTHSGVEPTAFGRLVLERGSELLAGEADLVREIRLHAGLETGTLAVSAGPHPFEISVVHALTRLVAEHPHLGLQATVTHARDVVRDVLSCEIDVGVTDQAAAADEGRLNFEPLPMHPIYLACRPGHPLANKRRVTAADIVAYPLASTLAIGHIAEFISSTGVEKDRFIRDSGGYRPAIHVNSLAIARQIASGSDALAPGIAWTLAADIQANRLVRLNYNAAELQTRYGIITLKGRTPSPPATKFISLLIEAEAEIVQVESKLSGQRTARSKSIRRRRRRRS